MTRLATDLPTAEQLAVRVRKGPTGACDIYGDGDLDDWRAVEALRIKTSWAAAQRAVDQTLEITRPIDGDKFRYHWRRRCWHWSEDQRRVELDDQ